MAGYITVLTTTDTAEGAAELARAAVEARAAACAQIDGPIRSVYWWDGAVQETQEWRVVYKLPAALYDALEALIKRVHTYDTPEIISTDIPRASTDYLRWLTTETTPR
ncbi:divalent-cation tolerance protein CutA [Streptacidiphilus sp. PB12-B1b]|uniref:divalent-cation tolerance protein CutA n=1 Tax=Streptacidiphilus sp. PB12-B1b TaxID=2705012 RepID=UPI0015FADE26|nr:divalent-cation tolerance protein CutA [Streptacidiphilus sp. PB12-B1b]QMU76007.1 divalent-cation tolerance protein CutA [Streptacidiphilus sp. PB12-B1b]